MDALDELNEDTRKSLIDSLLGADSNRISFLWTARSTGDMVGFRSIYCNSCGFTCGDCDSGDAIRCRACLNIIDYAEMRATRFLSQHSAAKVYIAAQDNDIRVYIEKRIKESNRLSQICQRIQH